MNFEEWYNKHIENHPYIVHPNYGLSKASWDACKDEVLKLLKNSQIENIDLTDIEIAQLFKKIEKL